MAVQVAAVLMARAHLPLNAGIHVYASFLSLLMRNVRVGCAEDSSELCA